MRREVRGKTVVISGAAGGLGAALAAAFGAAGAHLVALDLDPARLQALAATLAAQGVTAQTVVCDITDAAACRAAIAAAEARFGGIDVLVNNAGISARCLLRDSAPEVAARVMAVNFFGAVNLTQAALEPLIERRGQIVTISSVAGFAPLVGRTAYAASKHALHGFFDSLRAELRASGVGVLLACPAFIEATGIEAAALGADGRAAGKVRRVHGATLTPAAAAAVILRAAQRDQRLCLPTATARAAWWLSRLWPTRYEALMLRRLGAEFDLDPAHGGPP